MSKKVVFKDGSYVIAHTDLQVKEYENHPDWDHTCEATDEEAGHDEAW